MVVVAPSPSNIVASNKLSKLSFLDLFNSSLAKETNLHLFLGKVSPWVKRFPIYRIDRTNPVNIYVSGHDLVVGDRVYIKGVNGMTEINGLQAVVDAVNGDQITINAIDASAFSVYDSGGVLEKVIDATPPLPGTDEATRSLALRSAYLFRKVHTNSFAFGIDRIEWVSGNVYTPYAYDIEQTPSYVVVGRDVYVCIDNNGGAPSTVMPDFKHGMKTLGDGYVWRHVYHAPDWIIERFGFEPTVFPVLREYYDLGDQNFMDSRLDVQSGILSVDVVSGGSGYVSPDDVVLTVVGDGQGAKLSVRSINNGSIVSVNVDEPGSGYSWAEISVVGRNGGSGAIMKANISPLYGVGFDTIGLLRPRYLIVSIDMVNDEERIPYDCDYRVIGLCNMLVDGNRIVGEELVTRYYKLYLDNVVGTFVPNDVIRGRSSGAVGYVVKSDGFVGVSEVSGNFLIGETVETSTGLGVIRSIEYPEVMYPYGDLVFVDFRSPVRRHKDQKERLKLIFELWA